MGRLDGQVAVVAGATRGAGRGIAAALGEAGVVVYCTGRSSRGHERDHGHHYAGRPETIEETAELVRSLGGEGVAVRVDHRNEDQVVSLFERIREERGRLDILVNVLTHTPVEDQRPFVELDVTTGRAQVEGWIWPHVITARHALPLMIASRSGLVIEIIEHEGIGWHGQMWFDMFETMLKRLAYGIAVENLEQGITALSLTPGFMRTEAILEHFGATAETWREVAETDASAKQFGLIASETPRYVGRAIVELAADPTRQRLSGGVYSVGTLSGMYDFTDVDGTRPNMARYLAEHHANVFRPKRGVVHWALTQSSSSARGDVAAATGG